MEHSQKLKRYTETQFVPISVAREQIRRMEDDMRRTHKHYLELMDAVDENYKQIEEEAQEHFEEFLSRWKEVAREKIGQYRTAFEGVKAEKEEIQTRLEPVVVDLTVRNKKLVADYEKLLEKYNNDLEAERNKAKEKEELLGLQYEEELSTLKQERIELEGLLEGMKSQKDGYEKTVHGLKRKMKERTLTGMEEVKAVTENYVADCARLVVGGIVSAVEARHGQEMVEKSLEECDREVRKLQTEVRNLERHKATLKDQIKRMSDKSPAVPMLIKENDANASVDLNKYEELLANKQKAIRRIQIWKAIFEKREGRKCTKDDCESIRDLFQELKKARHEIMEFKGQSAENTLDDSIISLNSDEAESAYIPAPANANDFSAEVEKLKRENEGLREELQSFRITLTERVPETEAIRQLKLEIESLNKSKEQLRVKYKEVEEKVIKESIQNRETLDDLNKFRKENERLQERIAYLSMQGQGSATDARTELLNLKAEYDKILAENQEQQKALQRLEPMEVKLLDLENKYRMQDNAYEELKEKYKQVGLERVAVGRKLLKMEQLEEERVKARGELVKADRTPQAQVLKELEKENEVVKKQLAEVEGENKTLQQQVGKLKRDKEELLDQLDRVKLLEEEARRLEATKQRLIAAEEDARQLRLQIAMGLPEAPKDMTTLVKDDYEKLLTDNKTLKDKIDSLEKKLANLKEVKKNYDEKVNEVFQLKQELKVLQVEHEQKSRKLGAEKELKAKVADLRKQLADKVPGEASNVRQEMRKVLEENKELESKMEEVEELKKKLMQAKAIADSNLAELEEAKQTLKKVELERDRYITKANKANVYMMERNNLRVQLAKRSEGAPESNVASPVKMELERMQTENAKLLKSLSAIDKAKKEGAAKDARIKELEGKLKTSKDRVKELESLLNKGNESKIKEVNDKFRMDMKETEKQLEKERQANKVLSQEMEKKTKMYDQLRENEFKDLQEQIKKLEAQRKQDITLLQKSSSEETAKKTKELESARASIAKLTEEVAGLTGVKSDLESKNSILGQNVRRLETELAKIGAEASKVVVLRETIDKLTAQIEKNSADYKVMEDKYKDEMLKRKKLHNIIEDMKGKIRVYCRVRPPNEQEVNMNSPTIVNIVDELTLKVNTKYGPRPFNFDSVFGPGTSQTKVFEDTKRLVQSAVDGYNVCIFAYGQTGAGKTFTIQGDDTNPGIAPRSFTEMYNIITAMNNYTCKLECYMVELYIDTLTDLLLPKDMRKNPPHLDIKEDAKGMIFIQDVTKYPIKNAEETRRIFDLGLLNRKTSSTQMNKTSSRSHLIFSILIETVNKQTKQRAVGKLSFVDLAGSERADKAGTSAERLKEGRAINKSLSALGNVISRLSAGGTVRANC